MNIVTSIAQKIQPCTLCGVETFILIEFEWSQWTPPSLLFPSASSYERWNSRESESENGLAQPKVCMAGEGRKLENGLAREKIKEISTNAV